MPLQALSERFNGEIAGELVGHGCFFPDEYFTCSSLCLSCGSVLYDLFLKKKIPIFMYLSTCCWRLTI